MPTSVFLGRVGSSPTDYVASITGTADQVIASAATGAVTLSLPQSIATTSTPQFAQVTVGAGLIGTPSLKFAGIVSGLYNVSGNTVGVSIDGVRTFQFRSDYTHSELNTFIIGSGGDVILTRAAANVLGMANGANPQGFRPHGYMGGSRSAYGSVQTALASVTLSGATSVASAVIPQGAFVVGVATTTTTTITGASGYQIGDGSDADRWGDITGTAVGTRSANTDATANPTGWFAVTSNVTLTAKTSNFTGGVVQVVVFYVSTAST